MSAAGRGDPAAGKDRFRRLVERAGPSRQVAGSSLRTALVPLAAVGVAFVIERVLEAAVGFTPLIVFHGATAAATWVAGPLAGVLSALLSFIVGERYFFANSLFETFNARALTEAIEFWIAAGSIIVGLALLRLALQRASRGARRAERLTNRVRRRNAESRRAAARYRVLSEVTAALLPKRRRR
jgi:hypothetical protein